MGELGSYAPIGATGLIMLTVLLIFRGALVPRLYYDQLQRANDKLQQTNDELLRQNGMLLEGARTTQKVIESFPQPPGG